MTPTPVDPFAEVSIDSFVSFETCVTAMDIVINVSNVGEFLTDHDHHSGQLIERRSHRREALEARAQRWRSHVK